jgi:SAM-dependent methyltransferase
VNVRAWIGAGIVGGAVAGFSFTTWCRQLPHTPEENTPEHARRLLERAAPLLRLPSSKDRPPEVLPDGSGLRCPTTGTVYPYRDGILDLLPEQIALTDTQHLLNTPLTAWAYDRGRDLIMRWFGLPVFAVEVGMTQRVLNVEAGDTVLDLACGHGNFTVEWAKRVGQTGLVIGLDISKEMLARAATHVTLWDLSNVLLIRGDAHHLPLVDDQIAKVNCSGGFHQLPDLPQALREIARISAPGATLTASTFAEGEGDRRASLKHWFKERFALHFVPLAWLGGQLNMVGYEDYASSIPGGWFGYLAARKTTP